MAIESIVLTLDNLTGSAFSDEKGRVTYLSQEQELISILESLVLAVKKTGRFPEVLRDTFGNSAGGIVVVQSADLVASDFDEDSEEDSDDEGDDE